MHFQGLGKHKSNPKAVETQRKTAIMTSYFELFVVPISLVAWAMGIYAVHKVGQKEIHLKKQYFPA